MADIIPLEDRVQRAKDKKSALLRKRKILAVRKLFHCTHCAFKCAKCGSQISPAQHRETHERGQDVPYRFCESCQEEYLDFLERQNGRGNPEIYWQNDAWLDLWQKWVAYQGTIDRFLKSKEFLQLVRELKQTDPDQ